MAPAEGLVKDRFATAFGGARDLSRASLTSPSAGAFQQPFQTMAVRGVGARFLKNLGDSNYRPDALYERSRTRHD